VAAAAFAPSSVWANPLDMFGAGPVNIAMGGTGTATADSYEAAYYNPAALGLLDRVEFGFGASVYRPWLTANYNSFDPDTLVSTPVSARRFDRAQVFVEAGIGAPIPLGKNLGRHLFFGLHVQSPADAVYSVEALEGDQPVFPLYENRNRRLVMNAALAGRYKWFMIGAGLSVLPTVKGTVKLDLADTSLDNYLGIDVGFNVSPNIGILIEPINGLTLGLSYRGAGQTDISLPVDAAVTGTPVYLTVDAATFWTPHEISFGVGWKGGNYSVAGDVLFSMFSRFRMASPQITVYDSGERDDQGETDSLPDAGFRDTASVRLGGEYRPIKPLALRAGFSWTQSPVTLQSGDTNMLGGDQYAGSFGIGFDAEQVGGPPIAVDAYFMAGAVINNTDGKTSVDPGNPGYPSTGGGGWFLNSGLSIRFGFR
jgi:long-subunit fatty acid transport protein